LQHSLLPFSSHLPVRDWFNVELRQLGGEGVVKVCRGFTNKLWGEDRGCCVLNLTFDLDV